jgi:hypothetical protein
MDIHLPPSIHVSGLEPVEVHADALGWRRIQQRRLAAIEFEHLQVMVPHMSGVRGSKRDTVDDPSVFFVQRFPRQRNVAK